MYMIPVILPAICMSLQNLICSGGVRSLEKASRISHLRVLIFSNIRPLRETPEDVKRHYKKTVCFGKNCACISWGGRQMSHTRRSPGDDSDSCVPQKESLGRGFRWRSWIPWILGGRPADYVFSGDACPNEERGVG